MTNLKKFRFDEKFSDLLDLGEIQQMQDLFYNRQELGESGTFNIKKVYMNSDKMLERKNECFDKLHQLIVDNIGQFYLIYQQMHFFKDKNREF